MLTEQEAQDLMIKLVSLREKAKTSDDSKIAAELKKHETICIEKFSYLVTMKTGRYKMFNNYDDLNQEGFEVLVKAMKNYNPKKGNAFWWFHKYIQTRISRSANLHTTIRYPLKIAKDNPPHKESVMPVLIEERYCPDKECEGSQNAKAIRNVMTSLPEDQKEVIELAYGFDGGKPMSINKICRKLGISRASCIKTIGDALSIMKENIKI